MNDLISKMSSLVLLLALTNPAFSVNAHFSTITGNWYAINTTKLSWPDAQQASELQGGHLATINSSKENKWISDTFGIFYNRDYYWLGGNDLASEGQWQWVNGEPWVYSNWERNEPNNDNNEHALTWHHQSSYNQEGFEWNNRDAAQLRTSLVEYSSEYFFNSETGHWYTINPVLLSWEDAKLAAEMAGGHLVSINTGAENKWISDTIGLFHNGDYYWLGGNDIDSEGQWQWSNEELWDYSNWEIKQPNNTNNSDHALTWDHQTCYNLEGFEWNDTDPSELRASLIEFESHPVQGIIDEWLDNRWSNSLPDNLNTSL